jgi:3-hydroxyisobutyrate dehydrogenase-like beta-hydroxyacid dehydrogenase
MAISIGFIGLGAMGVRMAAHLLGHDIELTVWNRSPGPAEALAAKGAVPARSPREAAAGRDLVISMLSDDDACRHVWLEGEHAAIAGIGKGTLVIESSTVSPEWVRTLAGAVSARGGGLLDAPVIGSRPQAEAASLIYVVGGDGARLEAVEPILRRMGSAVHHTGGIGTGAVVKLMANTLFALQVAACGELLEVGRRHGFDPAALQPILASLPVMSPAAAGASALIATEQFAPLFPIELVAKDMGYASALSEDADASHSLMQTVFAIYTQAVSIGLGEENITAVAKLYRDG